MFTKLLETYLNFYKWLLNFAEENKFQQVIESKVKHASTVKPRTEVSKIDREDFQTKIYAGDSNQPVL